MIVPQKWLQLMHMQPLHGLSRKPGQWKWDTRLTGRYKTPNYWYPKEHKGWIRTLESLRKLFRALIIENESCGSASKTAIACAWATTSLSFSNWFIYKSSHSSIKITGGEEISTKDNHIFNLTSYHLLYNLQFSSTGIKIWIINSKNRKQSKHKLTVKVGKFHL